MIDELTTTTEGNEPAKAPPRDIIAERLAQRMKERGAEHTESVRDSRTDFSPSEHH